MDFLVPPFVYSPIWRRYRGFGGLFPLHVGTYFPGSGCPWDAAALKEDFSYASFYHWRPWSRKARQVAFVWSYPADIFDGESGALEEAFSQPALDRLHGLVRRWMEKGKDPAGIFDEILKGDVRYLTCDEVGGGIIPMDGFEREYREAVGRLCCRIAAMPRL